MKFILTLIVSCMLVTSLSSQTSIQGKVTDEQTGEELIGANVTLLQGGSTITQVVADIDGNYSIDVNPGSYEVEVSYPGYLNNKISAVVINSEKVKKLEIQLDVGDTAGLEELMFGCRYYIPLIKKEATHISNVTSEDIVTLSKNNNIVFTTVPLQGKITDAKTNETLIAANISIYQDGLFKTGTVSDVDGNYSIELNPGSYELEISYIGFETKRENIVISSVERNQLDVELSCGINLPEIVVTEYNVPYSVGCCCTIGCTFSSGCKNTVKSEDKKAVSNIETLPALELKPYPNPAVNNLNIQLAQDINYLILRSINGKEVFRKNNITTGVTNVSVSALPAGTYVLQAVKGDLMVSKKVVVVGL